MRYSQNTKRYILLKTSEKTENVKKEMELLEEQMTQDELEFVHNYFNKINRAVI